MSMPQGVMVTLRSVRVTEDSHGDSDETVCTKTWGPCAVTPRSSIERSSSREPSVLTGLTIYGPAITIHADDRLVIDGLEYQVEGEPGVWRSPFTGWAPGIEVAVKRAS